MRTPGVSTTDAATSIVSSSTPTPSVTNNALIGSSNDNKPSTAAIVVPLAIFAVALAGLLFSLRQRSKTKGIQAQKNEPPLNRAMTKDSCTSGSSTDSSRSSRADLERAVEFLAGIRSPPSPRLTPLPPSIESKRRERRETRMRESSISLQNKMVPERQSISTSSSALELAQPNRQNEPLPPLPDIAKLDDKDMHSQHEIPRSVTYPVTQSHPSWVSATMSYHDAVEKCVHPSGHSFGSSSKSQPELSQTNFLSTTGLPVPPSLTGIPRSSPNAQQYMRNIPSSISQPSLGLAPHPASLMPVLALSSAIPSLSVPPASLQAPPPQPLAIPTIEVEPVYPEYSELSPQPRLKCEPTNQSPTRPRPAIPYSTRPQVTRSQINPMNPYDAIAKVLRTPRLG
ncbi:hypothetical protein RSOLAG1IB_00717 [Rhizoctonia solani AG-1 IB]|uniref:Transmembrane protein n=1 Tax=Thanatephorus cucumeris (strain AG1-IB / isolate 7/3/14) TaxID=1108050 RepID=A0A0B7F7K5_THACB|nr:hypothetical protein RSOLAG1IB_00717 [Rhizoctonia solani AG-1 IB]